MRIPSNRDAIYSTSQEPVSNFVFNTEVAGVFPDMINRSVPGYSSIIDMIGLLGTQYAQPNSCCYDLGCSLGAATLALANGIDQVGCHIIGIDNSAPMIDAAHKQIAAAQPDCPVQLICDDLTQVKIQNASVVVLNFTLQFIAQGQRQALLRRIHAGLLPGGLLILSEKIGFDDPDTQQHLTDMHHAFKRANGYSELEIAQKRTALERVLIPETLDTHRKRLNAAGFASHSVWFQCFNFISMVCFKSR